MDAIRNASSLIPDFYNDLDASLRTAWAMLARGVTDRAGGFHTPVVASVDADGKPQARTMILRGVDAFAKTLTFHTDVRSAKIAQWQKSEFVCVVFYDHKEKIQVRVDGTVSLHRDDPLADELWHAARPTSQLAYAANTAPGTSIAAPLPAAVSLTPDARKNFCAAVIHVACWNGFISLRRRKFNRKSRAISAHAFRGTMAH
jgi:pyridoxamine 5'-phosphate oxidase